LCTVLLNARTTRVFPLLGGRCFSGAFGGQKPAPAFSQARRVRVRIGASSRRVRRAGERQAARPRKAREPRVARGEGRRLAPLLVARAFADREGRVSQPVRLRAERDLRGRAPVGGGRTTPVTVVVTPGTRLHFENRDPFAHKLYGVGQSTFPPGEMAALAARDWTAPGPGRYEIRDELSPSVRSWVVVEPNVAAIAYPSVQGMFLIPQLAAGEYTLKAFFSGSQAGSPRTFVLGGAVVDVALTVAEGVTSKVDAGERD